MGQGSGPPLSGLRSVNLSTYGRDQAFGCTPGEKGSLRTPLSPRGQVSVVANPICPTPSGRQQKGSPTAWRPRRGRRTPHPHARAPQSEFRRLWFKRNAIEPRRRRRLRGRVVAAVLPQCQLTLAAAEPIQPAVEGFDEMGRFGSLLDGSGFGPGAQRPIRLEWARAPTGGR